MATGLYGKQQIKSLATLSTEKMYKQKYFDKTGHVSSEQLDEFKPSVSNFKMPVLND